jgi:tetratricopeptide (TPR) repeat protein
MTLAISAIGKKKSDNTNVSRLIEFQRLLAPVMAARWVVMHVCGDDPVITNELGFTSFRPPDGSSESGIAVPIGTRTILGLIPTWPTHARCILEDGDTGQWRAVIEHVTLSEGDQRNFNAAIANIAQDFLAGPTNDAVECSRAALDSDCALTPGFIGGVWPLPHIARTHEFEWYRAVTVISKKSSELAQSDFQRIAWPVVANDWSPVVANPIRSPEFLSGMELQGDKVYLSITAYPADELAVDGAPKAPFMTPYVLTYARDMVKAAAHAPPDEPAAPETVLAEDPLAGNRFRAAKAYQAAGQHTKAIPLFRALMTAAEHSLGADHRSTVIARSELANAYLVARRFNKALPLYERTARDASRVLGAKHRETLALATKLAEAYRSAGRLEDAIARYELTVGDMEGVLGLDHTDTLAARNNLAAIYRVAGLFDEAISLHETVVADMERVYGSKHAETLAARNNLAVAYKATGRLDEAIALHEANLADIEQTLGAGHPNTRATRNNLAEAYTAAGRTLDAKALFEPNRS